MRHVLPTRQEPRSKAGWPAAGVGLALVIIGLVQTSDLWSFSVDSGSFRHLLPDNAIPWAAVLGLLAIVTLTWRLATTSLAAATILTILYAAVWHAANGRHGVGLPEATSVDAGLSIAHTLWLSLNDGVLGWVLDVLLSKVFPIFILGGALAGLTSLGSPPNPQNSLKHPAGRLTGTLHSVGRCLIPTLAIGSLFMMERPGIDLPTIAVAWLLPVSFCFAWFWVMPATERGTTETKAVDGRDAFLLGLTLAALALALVSGLPLQLSAVMALGVVIMLSLLDADIRQRPKMILLALARSGIAFGRLLVATAAVGFILAVLNRTGLPIDVAELLAAVTGEAKLPMLVLATMAAIAMGLVMPGFAAYLIVAALIGPALRTVGIASPTAHLLVLVAAAVTVAIGRGARSKAVSSNGGGR